MTAIFLNQAMTLNEIIQQVAPKRFTRDPFGIVSGYRAFLVYSYFNGQTDEELSELGLTRTDIPRLASDVIFEARKIKRGV